MRALLVTLIAAFILLLPVLALAEEEEGQGEMSRQEACQILGNCGDEMIAQAEQMQAQCNRMIEMAQKLKKKGIQLKTQGQVFQDAEMIAEGEAMIQQAERMEEEARKMNDACRILIEEGQKKKKRAAEMGATPGDDLERQSGDHN